MRIGLERPDRPDVVQLVDELDAYQKPMYPPESHHGIDLAALSQPNVVFAVVRDDDDRPIGCGAVVVEHDFGELKRMYLRPANRGRGLAAALLAFLEGHAAARGCTRLMLETGVRQPEALAFYRREGFAFRPPFADYADDPLSVFMEKTLAQ
ncbi:MAG TPA: GNAT family N-acetyltransferase [Casimicrobiaceae bacterium]|nr:GNAT family N-acetyltransferase [Casimicrobiaceae bacterium]